MAGPTVGLLHPGEMGAAVGAALRAGGARVLWASAGRSEQTARRAARAGLEDAGSVTELMRRCGTVVSVCPPHAAAEVAGSVAGFTGLYLDANAISPARSRTLAATIEGAGGRYLDGGIVGPPPREHGTTRLYLSGPDAEEAAGLFAGSALEARVVSAEVGAASALKLAFAAWTKGTAALLLAIRALARAEGVEAALLAEWAESLPELERRSQEAARSAGAKGWRWIAEMEEIAGTFAVAGLPEGFHRAAAELYRRAPHLDDATLEDVLAGLRRPA